MMPDTATESQDTIQLDLSESEHKRLANAAQRASNLLQSTKAPELIACLDDFLGVIYSLIFATIRGFKDRTSGPIEVDKVKIRAEQVANGTVRTTGAWMAGYHFNSALFRTSAVYHRILKTLNKRDASLGILLPLTHAAYRSKAGEVWPNTNIEQVREQVNSLKHDADGTYHARKVTYEQEVSAAEELLDLLEVILK